MNDFYKLPAGCNEYIKKILKYEEAVHHKLSTKTTNNRRQTCPLVIGNDDDDEMFDIEIELKKNQILLEKYR
jgi:hypothetical protein